MNQMDDCQVCPCPQVEDQQGNWRAGKCYEMEGHPDSPLCSECPTGRIGSRCELCEDGYFGDPEGQQVSSLSHVRTQLFKTLKTKAWPYLVGFLVGLGFVWSNLVLFLVGLVFVWSNLVLFGLN